ncbi:hypothetical protein H6F38_36240 [Paenibacillus sp. EKM208P]|nr:hypothetical protein H6F38_36240 [Paenibacillus sp. EKM208P]
MDTRFHRPGLRDSPRASSRSKAPPAGQELRLSPESGRFCGCETSFFYGEPHI